MTISARSVTLAAVAAIVMLAGCSSGGSATLGPDATASFHQIPFPAPATRTHRFSQRHPVGYASCPCEYVSNTYAYMNANFGSLQVFPTTANGNAQPIASIEGRATGLTSTSGVAVDTSGTIYASNYVNDNYAVCSGFSTVTVYAPGSNGNAPPSQAICGSATGLFFPTGIAVSQCTPTPCGMIYVVNLGRRERHPSVTVYNTTANGNTAPVGTIAGSLTKLNKPFGVAVDASGNIYVANAGGDGGPRDDAGSVTVYPANTYGDIAPSQRIHGRKTFLAGEPFGIAVDTQYIYTAGFSNLEFEPYTVNMYPLAATGNVAPTKYIGGSNTELTQPLGVSLDASGNIYAVNYAGGPAGSAGMVTVFPGYASLGAGLNNVAPSLLVAGSSTELFQITGIAVQ